MAPPWRRFPVDMVNQRCWLMAAEAELNACISISVSAKLQHVADLNDFTFRLNRIRDQGQNTHRHRAAIGRRH